MKCHNRYRENLEPSFEGFQFSLVMRHSENILQNNYL